VLARLSESHVCPETFDFGGSGEKRQPVGGSVPALLNFPAPWGTSCYLQRKAAPKACVRLSAGRGCANSIELSVHYRPSDTARFRELVESLSSLVASEYAFVSLKADFGGSVKMGEVLEERGMRVPKFGVVVFQQLTDVFWLNKFGPQYTSWLGDRLSRLQEANVYSYDLSRGRFTLQVTEDIEDMYRPEGERLRADLKRLLGEDMFHERGKREREYAIPPIVIEE
jgi:hypothetical protein